MRGFSNLVLWYLVLTPLPSVPNNFGRFSYNSTVGFAAPSEIIGYQSYNTTSDHSIVGQSANGEASFSRIHTRFLDHDGRLPYNTPGGE
ncbi:uncharacterized protein PADG_03511 [Paracoccidioides brasiliensis Pb18]|uniref:Uncharacterized protein n=1 Tax=Paracoccidioides brasiliensis (strain Pb18) TaxID=502780 RepID=C1G8C5_PARBD|nr:uncharacterized protein PADG_03511 [Paracoccidioides brasiliensis Pb18]EEH47427.2 hypothetical protein PADG_03511 [Paracoccidioides brasiliensis Pb18]